MAFYRCSALIFRIVESNLYDFLDNMPIDLSSNVACKASRLSKFLTLRRFLTSFLRIIWHALRHLAGYSANQDHRAAVLTVSWQHGSCSQRPISRRIPILTANVADSSRCASFTPAYPYLSALQPSGLRRLDRGPIKLGPLRARPHPSTSTSLFSSHTILKPIDLSESSIPPLGSLYAWSGYAELNSDLYGAQRSRDHGVPTTATRADGRPLGCDAFRAVELLHHSPPAKPLLVSDCVPSVVGAQRVDRKTRSVGGCAD